MLIEGADSTWRRDYIQKARIYANAGIPEYWILDINHQLDINRQQVTVLRQPQTERYQSEQTFTAADTLAAEALPEVVIALQNLLF